MAAKKKAAPSAPTTGVTIPSLNIQRAQIRVIGDSALICHQWSEKAIRAMLDKQQKKARTAKEAKDPEADYWGSLYILQDHPERDVSQMVFGFPATGFKNSIVDAASFVEGLTKVQMRGALHLVGEHVVITGMPRMRQDMVRVGMMVADVRHRGEFAEWSAVLDVRFNASVLSIEQIVHLVSLAGFSVGVGEWRPQRDGSFGRFHVATEGE